ncbi:MAG: hypothetical protein WCP34_13210, partial [Pseudomonadota bacterium]
KPSRGIAFSEAEESTVERINAISKRFHGAQHEIGKIVDDIVAIKGGPAYGESTLDRLSKHPALECSREQLRRCWQYYRLSAEYGKELEKSASSLKYSHLYQISRLLDINEEAVRREAVLAMATKAVAERMTATAIANAVSTHLQSIGQALRGKGASGKAKAGQAEDAANTAFAVLRDTSETVVTAAEQIISAETIEHVAELRSATNRLGFAYVQLVAKLVPGDEDALADARKVAHALAAAIEVSSQDNRQEGGAHAEA